MLTDASRCDVAVSPDLQGLVRSSRRNARRRRGRESNALDAKDLCVRVYVNLTASDVSVSVTRTDRREGGVRERGAKQACTQAHRTCERHQLGRFRHRKQRGSADDAAHTQPSITLLTCCAGMCANASHCQHDTSPPYHLTCRWPDNPPAHPSS